MLRDQLDRWASSRNLWNQHAYSITNVDDDFEANAGGTITMYGGTHTVAIDPTGTGNFGAQNNSTFNFLGGTVSGVDLFRSTATGTINVGGAATITADTECFFHVPHRWIPVVRPAQQVDQHRHCQDRTA